MNIKFVGSIMYLKCRVIWAHFSHFQPKSVKIYTNFGTYFTEISLCPLSLKWAFAPFAKTFQQNAPLLKLDFQFKTKFLDN